MYLINLNFCLLKLLLQALEVMYRALQWSGLRLHIKSLVTFSLQFVYKYTHLLAI